MEAIKAAAEKHECPRKKSSGTGKPLKNTSSPTKPN